MTRLRRFGRLPASERRLLARAVLVVAAVRLALWVVPFHRVRRLFVTRGPHRSMATRRPSAERFEWAVRSASRCVPAATCLCQSLALHQLLARAGYASTIQIGVRRDPRAGFQAHAWIEHGGRPLLNQRFEVEHYAPLPAWWSREGTDVTATTKR